MISLASRYRRLRVCITMLEVQNRPSVSPLLPLLCRYRPAAMTKIDT